MVHGLSFGCSVVEAFVISFRPDSRRSARGGLCPKNFGDSTGHHFSEPVHLSRIHRAPPEAWHVMPRPSDGESRGGGPSRPAAGWTSRGRSPRAHARPRTPDRESTPLK